MVTITKYVWDPVFDCVTHELDENNAVKAVYNNEPQQYGGVLSQRRGTTSHYHHHDALGSTRFLTDSSGNVTDTYLHDAWGNEVASNGTTMNPFRWVGRYGYYQDTSTGLVYVRARMYQPTVARWCSVDLFRFMTGVGFFQLVSNRPLLWTDASGWLSDQSSPYCGPDVTEWFDTQLKAIRTSLKNLEFRINGEEYRNFWLNLKFEVILAPYFENPCCNSCVRAGQATVGLCNACIGVTDLGNIAAGLLGGIGSRVIPGWDYPEAALFGAFLVAANGGRGADKVEDVIPLLKGLLLHNNGYPATNLCDALNNRKPLLKGIDYNSIITSLKRIDAIYPGSPLTDWNNRVGSKFTPPITWEDLIRSAFPQASRALDRNSLGPNSEMDFSECSLCPEEVAVTVAVISIGPNGHPIVSGVVLK